MRMMSESKGIQSELRSSQGLAWLGLLFVVPWPSLGAYFALHAAPGGFGQALFAFSKIWIFLFPWAWVKFIEKRKTGWPAFRREGMGVGLATGLAIFALIWAAFLLFDSKIDRVELRQKIGDAGLDSVSVYIFAACYWTLINSLIEEYLWRWFVPTQGLVVFGRRGAIFAAGVFFALHHIVAMAAYLTLGLNLLAALGVAIGGMIWSWIYLRYRNLWAAYLSHILADLGVFSVGYLLLFKD